MKKTFWKAIGTVAALAIGVGVGTATSFIASASSTPNDEPSAVEKFSAEDYGITNLAALPTVDISDIAQSSDPDNSIEFDSAQLLHRDDATSLYAAWDHDGLICLVIHIAGEDWVTSTACSDPDAFVKSGVGLRTNGDAGDAEAYLLPDSIARDASTNSRSATTGTETPNVLVVDPAATAEERAEIARGVLGVMVLPEIEDE